jgi:hypothetical protein
MNSIVFRIRWLVLDFDGKTQISELPREWHLNGIFSLF